MKRKENEPPAGGRQNLRKPMPAPHAVVTTEGPAAPILLSLYTDHGMAGRVELSPLTALHLAADLLAHVVNKGVDNCPVPSRRPGNEGANGAQPRYR